MKTALLHYWLTNMRGGEKVLAAFGEMFPEADIFTHAYVPAVMDRVFGSHRVRESFIASLPFGRRRPQAYLPIMPSANRRFDLRDYDLIISSESGPVKGVVKRGDQRHVCYCHTPMRYVWDMYDDYYHDASPAARFAMRAFVPHLRDEDLRSAESVDEFVANSHFVADRIRRIYGRDAKVVHPPVDVGAFLADGPVEKGSYYLYAGANVKYKRLDLAQAACRRMGRELKVASGVPFEELKRLYAGARALLFPGLEDFGIVPVEAQASGTPVIAYGKGGALETVKDGETGLFFEEQTVESICGAIEEFESRAWDVERLRANARRFSSENFFNGMRMILDNPPELNREEEVKVLVATHKPYRMPSDDVYVPLQVGAFGKETIAGCSRDDVGENISCRNANYCELTGFYWAWKNLGCARLGLAHYRRYFRGRKGIATGGELKKLLRTTGAILPKKRNYFIETNYSQYVHAHHAQDLDVTREIIAGRYPAYLAAFDKVMKARTGHRFNMFVMRKDFADSYCEWLFDVLFELERRLDISEYSEYDARVFGFVSERLLDVWLAVNRIAYRELPVVNLESQHWPRKIFNFLMRKFDYRENRESYR